MMSVLCFQGYLFLGAHLGDLGHHYPVICQDSAKREMKIGAICRQISNMPSSGVSCVTCPSIVINMFNCATCNLCVWRIEMLGFKITKRLCQKWLLLLLTVDLRKDYWGEGFNGRCICIYMQCLRAGVGENMICWEGKHPYLHNLHEMTM